MTNNVDFCRRLLGNIHSDIYYPIKRSFGQTLATCNLNALIAYTKLSDTKNSTKQNKEFLVAGLCYNTLRADATNLPGTYVKFEQLLKRLVSTNKNANDPRKKEIERFLQLRYDDNGYFAKRFYTLAKRLIPLLNNNETFDYISLLYDLENWDKDNKVKMKWAMAIVNLTNETENNTEKAGN